MFSVHVNHGLIYPGIIGHSGLLPGEVRKLINDLEEALKEASKLESILPEDFEVASFLQTGEKKTVIYIIRCTNRDGLEVFTLVPNNMYFPPTEFSSLGEIDEEFRIDYDTVVTLEDV